MYKDFDGLEQFVYYFLEMPLSCMFLSWNFVGCVGQIYYLFKTDQKHYACSC